MESSSRQHNGLPNSINNGSFPPFFKNVKEGLILSNKEEKNTENRLPRKGSLLYKLYYEKSPKKQKKLLKRFKFMNKWIMVPLYRARILPLFGAGRIFLILQTKGRKSGKIRRTPIEYRKINGIIHVFASRGEKAHWYRNMVAHPDDVYIQLGFKTKKVKFEVVDDFSEKLQILKTYVTKWPKAARTLFGYNPKHDTPDSIDLSQIAKLIKIIRLYPQ